MHDDGYRYDSDSAPAGKHALREKKEAKPGFFREHRVPRWIYRVIAILFAAALAILAWFNRANLAPENVVQWVRTSIVGMGVGDGYPKNFSGSAVLAGNFVCSGKNVVYASDTALTVCNDTGKELLNAQHSFSNPLMRVSGIRVLLCGLGGKNGEVVTTGGSTVKLTAGQNILGGAIAPNGRSALITAANGYCGMLTAFDTAGKVISYYWFSDYYPTAVALSPDGTRAAVTAVSAKSGELVSAVYLISLSSGKTVQPVTVCTGNLLSAVFWDTDASVAAVGDTGAVLLNPVSSAKKEYDFGGAHLTAFCSDTGRLALGLAAYDGSPDSKLAVIDASANEIYTGKLSGKILSVSLSGQTAAALTAGKLWFCPLSSTETTGAADAGGDACAVALKDGDSAYLLGISSVRLVNRR